MVSKLLLEVTNLTTPRNHKKLIKNHSLRTYVLVFVVFIEMLLRFFLQIKSLNEKLNLLEKQLHDHSRQEGELKKAKELLKVRKTYILPTSGVKGMKDLCIIHKWC